MTRLLTFCLAAIVLAGCSTAPRDPSAPVVQDGMVRRSQGAEVMQTPVGALNPDVTQATINDTICVAGWTATVRPSSTYTGGVKAKLLREHGLPLSDTGRYELDHFIPLALGGHPRQITNLWLQAWDGEWSARRKDQLEVKLKNMVCVGALSLAEARRAIAEDWHAAWARFVGRGARDVLKEPVE